MSKAAVRTRILPSQAKPSQAKPSQATQWLARSKFIPDIFLDDPGRILRTQLLSAENTPMFALTPFAPMSVVLRFMALIATLIYSNLAYAALPAAPATGLTAYFAFEDDVLDSSGNHNGTLVGGASYAPGVQGNALNMDSLSRYVSVPGINVGSAFTYTGWYLPSWDVAPNGSTTWQTFFHSNSYCSSGNGFGAMYNRSTSSLTLYVGDSCGGAKSFAVSIPSGAWFHFAITYDGASINTYINGVRKNSFAWSGSIANSSPFVIGANLHPLTYNWQGRIDEVRIYGHALGSDEVAGMVPPPGSTFALDVSGSGAGTGTVTSGETPPHIDCTSATGVKSGTCSSSEAANAVLTLTATPAAGSTFTGWTGCDNSQTADTPPKCVVTMTAATAVGAGFGASATYRFPPVAKVGEQVGITSTPPGSPVGNCTSSNVAVATALGSTVSVVGRGTTTITCGSSSAPLRGVAPQVLDLSPRVAILGEATVFTASGIDLDVMLDFEIGGGFQSSTCAVRLTNPVSLVTLDSSSVRHFNCIPDGAAGVFPAHLWLHNEHTQDFMNIVGLVQLDVELKLPILSQDETGKRNAFATTVAKYGANGSINWAALTRQQLGDIQSTLKSAGVDVSMPDALRNLYRRQRDDLYADAVSKMESVGGSVTGYTWRDLWPGSGYYSGWASSIAATYTVGDYAKLLGGMAVYGTSAVLDAIAVAGVPGSNAGGVITKWLKKHGPAVPVGKAELLGAKAKKAITFLNSWKGKLLMGSVGGTLQLSAAEKIDLKEIYDDYAGIAVDLGSDGLGDWLASGSATLPSGMAAKFVLGTLANLGPYLVGQGESKVNIDAVVKEMTDAAWGSVPVASAWKDMYELAEKIDQGASSRFYSKIEDIWDAYEKQADYLVDSTMALKLSRLFDANDDKTGAGNETKPIPFSGDLPALWQTGDPSTIKRMVIVTHGWNSNAATWPDELVRALCVKVGGTVQTEVASAGLTEQGISKWCDGSGGWRIASYDWKQDSALWQPGAGSTKQMIRSPTEALARAVTHGNMFALKLKSGGIRPDVVHLIGHSAGSGFVETLSRVLKDENASATIHSTFLDSFCPDPDACDYGESATWAEQYVDRRESLDDQYYVVGPRQTNTTLKSAYNFDVTELDPQWYLDVQGASLSTPAETAWHALWNATASHAYPYRVYVETAGGTLPGDDAPINPTVLGAKLAAEYVGADPAATLNAKAQAYPPGYRCKVTASTANLPNDFASCIAPEKLGNLTLSNSGDGNFSEANLLMSTCQYQATGAGTTTDSVILTTCNQQSFSGGSSRQTNASSVAVAPFTSTFRYSITTVAESNQISFSYQFTNASAAGSILLFVDDEMVYASTQQVDGVEPRVMSSIAMPRLSAGVHTIQLVLSSSNGVNAGLSFGAVQFTLRSASVLEVTAPRLINLSTRGPVQTGDNVMIGGFVIGGSTPKKVLIRVVGPTLANYGVTGVLADPTLQLFSGQTPIASNNDWGISSNAAEIQAAALAPVNPLESAILATLNPGAYTAIVSGVNNGTGVAIIEVYDLDHPEAPLINISTRGKVQTGDGVMIGGFIIQGSGPQTVLIRAGGPTLANYGVTGVLADPKLELHRSSDGAVIDSNDNWADAVNAAAISATGLAPVDAKESAILITLQPGAYTAIVSGADGGSGVGIVEVFAQ